MTPPRPPTREPLLFTPLLKQRVWGGRRLGALGKAIPAGTPIGESWEIADLDPSVPDGRSVIARGPLIGRTLRHALDMDSEGILGVASRSPEGGFPLLVKFLDAGEALSVQVHPDAAYVRRHPGAHEKNEAWVVVDARPGAVVYRGVRPEVDRDRFFAAVEAGSAVAMLETVEVAPGDCLYLPSGLCHALGDGILVVEVQTPSDTTFRVYDWNRRDPGRALHLSEARECMLFGADQETSIPGVIRGREVAPLRAEGFETRRLCRTPAFSIERIDAPAGAALPLVTQRVPVIWTLLEGAVELEGPGGSGCPLAKGDTVLLPAMIERWTARFTARTAFLRTSVASPLDRALV